MEQTKKKKFQMPSAYTVLFIIIAIIAVLTWFIPAGHYGVDADGNIIAGSYERVQQNPQGLWDIFMAPINGMLGRSEEHTSELQSRFDLVCRLLLEKKNNK